jgi:hypothetical protein
MASYLDILRPQVLTQVVRQVVASADPILNFMGFEPGGSNEKYYGHGREGTFHVFDDTRKVAKSRAPGTAAARSSKQPMKQIPFVYPRMHDSVSLLAEFVHNLSRIDDPALRDQAGKDMIMRQTNTLQRKAANWRIAMTVGMLRDQLYVHQEGDDWFVNYTSGSALYQISHRVPAGNKSQLNIVDRAGTSIFGANIIDVTWAAAGANIPLHFAKINQARANLGVGPVTDVLLNSVLWQNVCNNDYLAAQAGIANPPFATYEREVGKRPDGSPLHEYIGRFNALPGVTWHITDEGLDLWNASTDTYAFAKHFDDTMAIFLADPKQRTDGFTLYQGSEPIAEYDGGPETVRVGLSSWSKKTANPTATEIYVLDNALPVNHDPYAIQIGTVVF